MREPARSKAEFLMGRSLDLLFPDEKHEDNYRPEWLEGLELDRFYPRLGVAFEFQGAQHFSFVSRFHRSSRDLRRQQKRDKKKLKLCTKKKIILIAIKTKRLTPGSLAHQIIRAVKGFRNWPQAGPLITAAKSYDKEDPKVKQQIESCQMYRRQKRGARIIHVPIPAPRLF